MSRAKWTILVITLAGSVCLLGNSPPPPPLSPPGSSPAPGIELAAIGVPAGWMGQDTTKLKEAIKLNGAEAEECGGDSKCLRITYKPQWGWAGVYWWPTACDKEKDPWAAVKSGSCAIDLRQGPDSRPITRLTFLARGAKGRETVTFGVGGDDLHPKKVQKRIDLEPCWKTYEIDLANGDLKKATALFFWTASELDNPSGFVIYLKDIRFTGTP